MTQPFSSLPQVDKNHLTAMGRQGPVAGSRMRKAAGGSGLPERTKKQTHRVYSNYEAAPNESGRRAPGCAAGRWRSAPTPGHLSSVADAHAVDELRGALIGD